MMARFSQSSSIETVGDSRDPDILYYNATIVNNTTDDTKNGQAYLDPPVRFNETRDTALIRDASRYQFSIIRFILNGGNKDLPLFIPQIQSGTGQTDPNLTEYGVGITANLSQIGTTPTNWACAPPLTYIEYAPETVNPILAPVPPPPSSPNYIGIYNLTTLYQPGQIVYYNTTGLYYEYNAPIFGGLPPTQLNPVITVVPTPVPTDTLYWTKTSNELGRPQNLSTKYYWVYTYDWWLTLVNTALDNANLAVYQTYTGTIPGNPAPAGSPAFATFAVWKQSYPSPQMVYDPTTKLFSLIAPTVYNSNPTTGTPAKFQLYFNVNMEGLFSNFPNNYYNDGVGIPFTYAPPTAVPLPDGYANAVLVYPTGGSLLALNVITNASLPVPNTAPAYAGNWFKMTQNFLSTSTLWSPIDSIVFTSALLPVQNEATAPPNVLGTKNTGNSAATSKSAFTPVITDVALDLSSDPSGYRRMIYYAPSAEYRMCDFQNSKFDIRNIDVQVFWRNRLDNQLYPVSMFNLSSVSIKIMFRKKSFALKSERY
jgi:hypothetical protein